MDDFKEQTTEETITDLVNTNKAGAVVGYVMALPTAFVSLDAIFWAAASGVADVASAVAPTSATAFRAAAAVTMATGLFIPGLFTSTAAGILLFKDDIKKSIKSVVKSHLTSKGCNHG